jgi:hypothetical protein
LYLRTTEVTAASFGRSIALFGFMQPAMRHGNYLMVCDENQFLKSTISGTGNAT